MTTEKYVNELKAAPINLPPEWVDHKGVRHYFGISRPHAYVLAREGKIRSISIRKPGAVKGRRLFDAASIRVFLDRCGEQGEIGDERAEATCCH